VVSERLIDRPAEGERAMRRVLVLTMLAVPIGLTAVPARASGGGGCGAPVTGQEGTTVAVRQFCFRPTILYANPGDSVTWTNKDSVEHNVAGSNLAWGSFQTLREDRTVTYRFTEPGIYPYVCSWHPGMSGAVVVGDGGSPTATQLVPGSVSRVFGQPITLRTVKADTNSGAASETTPWKPVAVGTTGLMLLILVAAGQAARRRGDA
jgi:plastocyanin